MTDLAMDSQASKHDQYLKKYKELYAHKTPAELRALAHIKRFLERFSGDSNFRSGILSGILDIEKSAQSIGCDIEAADFKTLLPLYHPDYLDQRTPELIGRWPAAKIWDEYIRRLLALRTEMLTVGDSNGYNRAFDLWRARQINRASLDLGIGGIGNVHPPIAFEVSSGCSVGCWFCGISAERFKGHYDLCNGGSKQWANILSEVRSVIGEALHSGFLYWATEPLDHPQYLEILDIFHENTKVYPQTTSAIPLRNIELTRGVIERWAIGGGYPNRFSILNTKTLLGVHEAFTPEELLCVELVLQNSGNSTNTKTDAGKAKTIIPIQAPTPVKKGFDMAKGTIACVSGFLVNIVEKTVRLVSPCMPTSEIPDGYIVFATSSYSDPADLGNVLRRMITEHMAIDLDPGALIKFSYNLSYSMGAENGSVTGSAAKFDAPMVDLFGSYLSEGPISPRDVLKSAVADGKNPFKVVNAIEKARRAGLIETVAH
jgi:radical SAM family RiPP maturation amino acid epimerase